MGIKMAGQREVIKDARLQKRLQKDQNFEKRVHEEKEETSSSCSRSGKVEKNETGNKRSRAKRFPKGIKNLSWKTSWLQPRRKTRSPTCTRLLTSWEKNRSKLKNTCQMQNWWAKVNLPEILKTTPICSTLKHRGAAMSRH